MLIEIPTADETRAVTQNLKYAAKFKTMIIELHPILPQSLPPPIKPPHPFPTRLVIVSSNRRCPAQRADTHPEDSQTLHATILHPWKDIWNIVCMDIYKRSLWLLPLLFRYRYICMHGFLRNQKQDQIGLVRSARWTRQSDMLLNLANGKLSKSLSDKMVSC